MYKLAFIIFFLIIFNIGCSDEPVAEVDDPLCGRFELLPETEDFKRIAIFDFFMRVALGSEFQIGVPVIKKWKESVKIFPTGNYADFHLSELHLVVQDLNDLLEGFLDVEMVADSTESNVTLFFGEKSEYLFRFPEVQENFDDAIGFFVIHHDNQFLIQSGHAFVDIHVPLQNVQRHLIREEITQILGLPNDMEAVNSIFYDKPSSTTYYSDEDKEVIRLLYRPEILPGMSEESVRPIVEGLLCL